MSAIVDDVASVLACVAREHQLGEPMGGTAVGSTCACSCGETNYVEGVRSSALARAGPSCRAPARIGCPTG